MKRYSFDSKVGLVTIFYENDYVTKINLQSSEKFADEPNEIVILAKKEILEYLDGMRKEFSFPISFSGSVFVKKVLSTMRKIPYGKTWSYSRLAKESDYEKAVRAVGTVCKNNPLPLIIPCHRVIKKSGDIGYFNGGVELKTKLLNIEKNPSK